MAEVDCNNGAVVDGEMLQEFDEVYCAQFFEFTPKSFVTDVYNIISDTCRNAVETFEKKICKEFPDAISIDEAKVCTETLLETATVQMDSATDKLEDYLLKGIFHIPHYVALPEDEIYRKVQKYKVSSKVVDKTISDKIQKIKMLKYVNAQLEQQLLDLESLDKDYDQTMSTITALSENCPQEKVSAFNNDEASLRKTSVDLSKQLKAKECEKGFEEMLCPCSHM